MSEARGFGERLLLAQHRAGMNQRQLAEKSGVGVATIRRAVAGQFTPRIETTVKLATALGVDRKWLAFGDGDGPGAADESD